MVEQKTLVLTVQFQDDEVFFWEEFKRKLRASVGSTVGFKKTLSIPVDAEMIDFLTELCNDKTETLQASEGPARID